MLGNSPKVLHRNNCNIKKKTKVRDFFGFVAFSKEIIPCYIAWQGNCCVSRNEEDLEDRVFVPLLQDKDQG